MEPVLMGKLRQRYATDRDEMEQNNTVVGPFHLSIWFGMRIGTIR